MSRIWSKINIRPKILSTLSGDGTPWASGKRRIYTAEEPTLDDKDFAVVPVQSG